MFNFLKNKTAKSEATSPAIRPNFFNRLQEGLQKTRRTLINGLTNLVLGKKTLDDGLLEEIEALLLSADIGVATTDILIKDLTASLARKELHDADAVIQALKTQLLKLLLPYEQVWQPQSDRTNIILVVGINGSGKTTTIGKLAHYFKNRGNKVLLAAGDTFRAAAVEQLQAWGERNAIPVIAQHSGADSASVIYDAVQSGRAREMNIVLADTAGRLHTQHNLMEELKKVVRVIRKIDASAPHEILLILDASIGQNGLAQAQKFHEAIGVTGLAITKLDGTAKGGIVFAVTQQLALPIRFVGMGEGIDDLHPFSASEFVDALFGQEKS